MLNHVGHHVSNHVGRRRHTASSRGCKPAKPAQVKVPHGEVVHGSSTTVLLANYFNCRKCMEKTKKTLYPPGNESIFDLWKRKIVFKGGYVSSQEGNYI